MSKLEQHADSGPTGYPYPRALVCCFCGKAWIYDGTSPKEPLLKEAYDHEAVCENNPYTAQITELVSVLCELSGLCERAWEGMVVGKYIRNHAKRVLLKYPENVNVDLPDTAAQDSASKPSNPAVSC